MLVTVDLLIFGPEGLVLVERGNEPFKGCWAMPGGFVDDGETTEQAAVREALEETGLTVKLLNIEKVLSKPGRDPRGQTISIVYSAKPVGGALKGADDASDARWFRKAPEKIAFDHREVIEWYLKVCCSHK